MLYGGINYFLGVKRALYGCSKIFEGIETVSKGTGAHKFPNSWLNSEVLSGDTMQMIK